MQSMSHEISAIIQRYKSDLFSRKNQKEKITNGTESRANSKHNNSFVVFHCFNSEKNK